MAYSERPPILATIELVDGAVLAENLPVTPDLSVEKVCDICCHFLSTEEPQMKCFSIFIQEIEFEDGNKDKPGEAVNPLLPAAKAKADERKASELKDMTAQPMSRWVEETAANNIEYVFLPLPSCLL